MRNPEAANEVRRLAAEGKTMREIANARGCSVPNIRQIVKRYGIEVNTRGRGRPRRAASGNIEDMERLARSRAGGDEQKYVDELAALLRERRESSPPRDAFDFFG